MYDKSKNISSNSVTAEMKREWSKQYGEGRCAIVKADGKICYLRPPSRTDVGAYGVAYRTNPVRANEFLLKQCWLAGDEEFVEDDKFFFAAVEHLSGLIESTESELEKF